LTATAELPIEGALPDLGRRPKRLIIKVLGE
jgi:hypothetical protein